MDKLNHVLFKVFSARFILAIMFGFTTCVAFLQSKMSVEAFMTLAGSVITFYFTRVKDENPMRTKTDVQAITVQTTKPD